jgi:hypothetical protein
MSNFYPTRKLSDKEEKFSSRKGYHYTVLVRNSDSMTIQELNYSKKSTALKGRGRRDVVLKVYSDGSATYENGPFKGCSYRDAQPDA